ncbi:MAG TPA: SDR family oxidoreductase [Gemmatimonadaceae bacterium]|nr:SDR family oxidoreductase [Gemmatimonadaceae bacterium]
MKTILVTGASSGIGAAVVARLAADGHRVIGTCRTAGPTNPDGTPMLELDVTSDASARACVARFLEIAGHIDVLINNAGYLQSGAIEEVTLEQARAQFETNYFGVVRMINAVLPAMRGQKGGLIATTSSLAGLVPLPFWGHYNASKWAVEALMETLRYELKPWNIHVAMVEPGSIKTPFYAAPRAAAMSAYAPWSEPFFDTMRGFETKAPGPAVVAALYSRIVRSHNPSLRNTVTTEAKLFPFLRWLLPPGMFENGVRVGFKIHNVPRSAV